MSDHPPSPSNETASPTPRRRPAASEEKPGGGAKILCIVLVVVVAALVYVNYQRGAGAEGRATAGALTIGTLTTNVAELRTRLALSTSNLEIAHSNHLAVHSRRLAEINQFSNRLVQASLLLDQSRAEARHAQTDAANRAGALALAEAERDEWKRQAAAVPVSQNEATALRERLQQSQFTNASLQESLGKTRAEKADLERRMEDPVFLRLQARHAEEAADLRRRTAGGQGVVLTDRRVKLELQPDGTIRAAGERPAVPQEDPVVRKLLDQ